jgi:hypothetical protein
MCSFVNAAYQKQRATSKKARRGDVPSSDDDTESNGVTLMLRTFDEFVAAVRELKAAFL